MANATVATELKIPEPAHGAQGNNYNAPDWEIPEEGTTRTRGLHLGSASTRWAIADRFDRIFPPYKRYVGLKRRTFLLILLGIVLAIIALAVGLGVGLSKKHQDQNLPLPSNAQTFTGDLTYYNPALGACGIDSNDNSPIVAVSHVTFDAVQTGSDPNQNPLCGRKIRARRVREDGKEVTIDVTVVDRCTGCQPTDIDVSPAMFNKMADPDLGRVNVEWAWLPRWKPGFLDLRNKFKSIVGRRSVRFPDALHYNLLVQYHHFVFHRDRDPYILNPMRMLDENKSDVPRPSPLKVSPSTTSHTPPRNDSPSPDYVKSGSSSIKSFGRGTQLGTNTTPRTETYPINTDIMDHVAVPKPLAPHSSCEGLSRTSDLRTAHATEYPVDEQRSIGHDQNVVTPSPYEYNWANGAVYSKEANTHPYQSSNDWPSGAAALQQDRDNVGYDVSPPDSPTAYRPHDNRSEISSLGVSLPNTFSEHQMPHVEQARPAPPELPDNSQNEPHTRLDPKYHVRQSLVDKVQRRSKSTRENHRRSRRCQKCKMILIGVLVLIVLSVVVTVLVVRIWGPARHRHQGVGTSTASGSSLTGSVSSTRTTDGMWGNTTTHTMRINSTITHEPGGIHDSTATRTAGGIHSSIKTHTTSEVRGSTETHTTGEVHSSSTTRTKGEVRSSTETHATSKTHSSASSVATKESVTHHSKYSASTTAAVTT